MKPRLDILVPAYNESARIVPMLRDYCEHFVSDVRITVITNGCTDDTASVVRALCARYPHLRMVTVNGKIGKGGAVRAGLKLTTAEYVAFADADGSTSAIELDRLVGRCITSGADGCIGSRWLPGSVVQPRQPLSRRIASRTFNAIVRALFRLPFADTQCGAKVFRRAAVQTILNGLEVADFAFDIEVLTQMCKRGFRIEEAPTTWADRAAGTKVALASTSWRMLKAILRMRLRETVIWRLPFLEFFARDSVIPVKDAVNVLFLAPPSFAGAPAGMRDWVLRCADEMRQHGCRITWSSDLVSVREESDLRYGARFWRWYAFESKREYDAVVEVASCVPLMLPVVSMKRRFLCGAGSGALSPLARVIYRLAYCRMDGEFDANESPLTVAWQLMERTGAGALYRAAFHEKDGTWALRFSDIDSGSWTLQTLK